MAFWMKDGKNLSITSNPYEKKEKKKKKGGKEKKKGTKEKRKRFELFYQIFFSLWNNYLLPKRGS